MRATWTATGVGLLALGMVSCGVDDDIDSVPAFDIWNQAANNEVDILFVVDDSISMEEEQNALANGFSSFAAQLDGSLTDFRLGVITTTFEYDDPMRGALVGDPQYLTPSDPYQMLFAQRALVGTGGNNREKGLEAAAHALSPQVNLDVNGGFVRPSARLLMVFVTDEEDCSDAGAVPPSDDRNACYDNLGLLTPVETFVQRFRALKTSLEDVQVAAIIGVDGTSQTCGATASSRYERMASLMRGTVGDICDGDWSALLADLGLNATGILDTFQLSRGVDPETLVVTVDGVTVTDYTYDATEFTITFGPGSVPERGSEIRADYTAVTGLLGF